MFKGCQLEKNSFKGERLEDYFQKKAIKLDYYNDDVWSISSNSLVSIKENVFKNGKRLKDWNINFRRGVLTGYNSAFIFNKETKQKIILRDKNSEKIIKPILRGRDTRKYYCNYHNLYMLCLFPSLKLNIENFPGAREHLLKFDKRKLEQTGQTFSLDNGEKVKARKKTTNKWFETQDTIAYHEELIKPKIVFSEIVSEPQFYYDTNAYYPEATAFLITGEHLKWLVAFLNSQPITVLFRIFYAGGELVGKYRYKKAFLETLPIPEPLNEYETKVEILVDYLTFYKGLSFEIAGNKLYSKYYESIVDGLVYEVLFPTEIKSAGKEILKHLGDLKPINDE